MYCPNCESDGVSFWRVWLLNFRQRVNCSHCDTQLHIVMPGQIAAGTFVLLIASAGAYFMNGGRGLSLVLLLFAIVANFLLTHNSAQLLEEEPDDAID